MPPYLPVLSTSWKLKADTNFNEAKGTTLVWFVRLMTQILQLEAEQVEQHEKVRRSVCRQVGSGVWCCVVWCGKSAVHRRPRSKAKSFTDSVAVGVMGRWDDFEGGR